MLKNGKALDYETRKSGVSHKWFDELRRLIEWFLCTDSDGMVFLVWSESLGLWRDQRSVIKKP